MGSIGINQHVLAAQWWNYFVLFVSFLVPIALILWFVIRRQRKNGKGTPTDNPNAMDAKSDATLKEL